MLRSGQIGAVNNLAHLCDLKGKKVLEIGGDDSHEVANLLLAKGASHVTTIGLSFAFSSREISDGLSAINLDAARLTTKFPAGTFDAAFGVAVLEHLNNLPLVLDQLHTVLKSEAVVLLHGLPIWTSWDGHHLWVDRGEKKYRFNSPDLNPISDWYHLLLDYESMIEYLVDEGKIGSEDAMEISRRTYRSHNLSRAGYSDLVSAFKHSRFEMVKLTEWFGKRPSTDIARRLEQTRWGGHERFDVEGLEFVVKKP